MFNFIKCYQSFPLQYIQIRIIRFTTWNQAKISLLYSGERRFIPFEKFPFSSKRWPIFYIKVLRAIYVARKLVYFALQCHTGHYLASYTTCKASTEFFVEPELKAPILEILGMLVADCSAKDVDYFWGENIYVWM